MANVTGDQVRISDSRPAAGTDVDAKILEKVRKICAALVRAVTASRIFPAHNDSVTVLRKVACARLLDFLDRYGDFELEIKQSAFLFRDEVVYQEDNPLRSLPYFLYKDGMQKLAFIRGLTDEEFSDFLDVVRSVSLLPLDVGDIVDALWQKDYEHIRYVSPDEFIEAKLSGNQTCRAISRSRRSVFMKADSNSPPRTRRTFSAEAWTWPKEIPGNGRTGKPLRTSERERRPAPGGHDRSRTTRISREKLPDMMFEVLHLEDRPEEFAQILAYLDHERQERVAERWNSPRSSGFLNHHGRTSGRFGRRASPGSPELEKIRRRFRGIRSDACPETIRESRLNGRDPQLPDVLRISPIPRPDRCSLGSGPLSIGSGRANFRTEAGRIFRGHGRPGFRPVHRPGGAGPSGLQ